MLLGERFYTNEDKSTVKRGHTPAQATSGAVTTAGTCIFLQPTVEVVVSHGRGAKLSLVVITDTGAQLCVAGLSLLSKLYMRSTLLQQRAGLRDVADLPFKYLGSGVCSITLGKSSREQDIYFIQSAPRPVARCLQGVGTGT